MPGFKICKGRCCTNCTIHSDDFESYELGSVVAPWSAGAGSSEIIAGQRMSVSPGMSSGGEVDDDSTTTANGGSLRATVTAYLDASDYGGVHAAGVYGLLDRANQRAVLSIGAPTVIPGANMHLCSMSVGAEHEISLCVYTLANGYSLAVLTIDGTIKVTAQGSSEATDETAGLYAAQTSAGAVEFDDWVLAATYDGNDASPGGYENCPTCGLDCWWPYPAAEQVTVELNNSVCGLSASPTEYTLDIVDETDPCPLYEVEVSADCGGGETYDRMRFQATVNGYLPELWLYDTSTTNTKQIHGNGPPFTSNLSFGCASGALELSFGFDVATITPVY